MRVTGRLHITIDRLYLNLGIAYEEQGDFNTAYECFFKWYDVCRDLFGEEHSKTRRPITTLNEPVYQRIATERGFEIPALKPNSSQN